MYPILEEYTSGDANTDFIFKLLVGLGRNRKESVYEGYRPYEHDSAAQLYFDTITKNGVMHFKDAKLPDIRWFEEWYGFSTLYVDSMCIYHLLNSDYSAKNLEVLERLGFEGPYGFEDIKVKKGDNVIDAGAFIGDWSCVARAEGGNVFAFDPSDHYKPILRDTARLNGFEVIDAGLGDKDQFIPFNQDVTPTCHSFTSGTGSLKEVKKVDTFAKERDIHIDFIKADTEGYELEILKGARETLIRDEPKIAFRTYHKEDDPKVLSDFIRSVNPKYRIIQRHVTLYAEVPE